MHQTEGLQRHVEGRMPASREFVGSSRSAYTPSVLVETMTKTWREDEDPILKKGLKVLGKLMIRAR